MNTYYVKVDLHFEDHYRGLYFKLLADSFPRAYEAAAYFSAGVLAAMPTGKRCNILHVSRYPTNSGEEDSEEYIDLREGIDPSVPPIVRLRQAVERIVLQGR